MTSACEKEGRRGKNPRAAKSSSSIRENPSLGAREFQPITAADISACAEGVKRTSNGYLGRCLHPQHEDKNPSMSFCDGPNGALIHCLSGCDQDELWAAVVEAVRRCRNEAPSREPLRSTSRSPNKTAAKKLAKAKRIYANTREAAGTPAGDYLQGRGVTAPPGRDLRAGAKVWRPATGQEEWALVACQTDTLTGAFLGVQCRFLDEENGKWDNVGNLGGGAVQLAKPEGGRLGVCESFIDALSITQVLALPCWATCGAGNLKDFRPPPSVSEVVVLADRDGAGLPAAKSLFARLQSEGFKVDAQVPPAPFKDFNELLANFQERQAIAEIDGELSPEDARAVAVATFFPRWHP